MTRVATVQDAPAVAGLLHAFNQEFDDETPGPEVLAERLAAILGGEHAAAILVGEPPEGVALLTFRPSVWDAGPAALLEELYVKPELRNERRGHALLEHAFTLARERGSETFEINVDEEDVDAQRFYEAHGVLPTEPNRAGRAFYYSRRL